MQFCLSVKLCLVWSSKPVEPHWISFGLWSVIWKKNPLHTCSCAFRTSQHPWLGDCHVQVGMPRKWLRDNVCHRCHVRNRLSGFSRVQCEWNLTYHWLSHLLQGEGIIPDMEPLDCHPCPWCRMNMWNTWFWCFCFISVGIPKLFPRAFRKSFSQELFHSPQPFRRTGCIIRI